MSQRKPSLPLKETLIIIDALNPLAAKAAAHLSAFLSSLLLGPHISLLATYHLDVPLSQARIGHSYQPDPLTVLVYLATAVLRVDRLSSVVARKKARDRSLAEPVFGLAEGREGTVVSPRESNGRLGGEVIVVEMEVRRKSGRGVREVFVLHPPDRASKSTSTSQLSGITLLDDNPAYSVPEDVSQEETGGEAEVETTFNLGLTEKQRRDREGVVLPYFDAQKDGGGQGPGEGGRILYEMGAEDREDFDDEEDEI